MNFRDLIASKNHTISSLSRETKISRPTITGLADGDETAWRKAHGSTIEKIARALNMQPEQLKRMFSGADQVTLNVPEIEIEDLPGRWNVLIEPGDHTGIQLIPRYRLGLEPGLGRIITMTPV